MDYEKEYKQLHKFIGDLYPHMSEYCKEKVEGFFPELRKSEDEKVKQAIVHILYENYTDTAVIEGVEVSEIITWLEKQGKKTIPLEDIIHNVWELGNLWKELTNSVCTTEYGRQIDYIVKHWKEGEHYIKSVEKLCGQKPINKVVPKFKVGDWIYCEGFHPALILNIVGDKYKIEFTDNGAKGFHRIDLMDRHCHPWTIEDSKDGDIVVNKTDGSIGIFQSIGHHPDGGSYNDPSYCFLHCRYDDGFFYADFENGNMFDTDDLIPATTGQRDFLFQKMAEAGYKWDADKKELVDNATIS